jgi:hypothetical protein
VAFIRGSPFLIAMPGLIFNRPAPLLDAFLSNAAPIEMDANQDNFSVTIHSSYSESGGGIRRLRARPPSVPPPIESQPEVEVVETPIPEAIDRVRVDTLAGDEPLFG